jgi:hypothetical protein
LRNFAASGVPFGVVLIDQLAVNKKINFNVFSVKLHSQTLSSRQLLMIAFVDGPSIVKRISRCRSDASHHLTKTSEEA